MPRRTKGERGSVRLDYDESFGHSMKELKDYYGIGSSKDLVRFLILQECRRLSETKQSEPKK